MNCINFTVRTKCYEKYFFCRKFKKKITYEECKDCFYKEYMKPYKIKNKSNKLANLERQRDEKIIKNGRCEYCKKFSKHLDPHEVYGGSNRRRSIEHNFVKLLCRECHSNPEIIGKLRIEVQEEFEKEHTREEFIDITGKSYIDKERR